MNQYTIYNANLLFSVKKFMKRSTEMTITLLINFYFEYNQVELHPESHDITIFQTPLGFL